MQEYKDLILPDEFTYIDSPVIVICTLGVASNVSLLVALIKDPLKCFRNSGTYLVANLSLCDCLTCLFVLLFYVMEEKSPSRSIVTIFLGLWFGYGSFMSIVSISVDRFLMVVYPIKHRIYIKGKSMVFWLVIIWMVSCVLPALRLSYASVREKIDKYAMYPYSAIIVTLSSVMYTFTYYRLKKQSKNICLQNSNKDRAQKIRILKEKKFLKTIIIIACIAFSCTGPSIVYFQLWSSLDLNDDIPTISVLNTVVHFIFFTNFAVNPLIYVVRLPIYRKTFQLLYCRGKL